MTQEPGHRALDAALELARMPTLAEAMRRQPLPGDVLPLIRVAAGCRKTCEALAAASGREPRLIAEAALFYLEQLLFRTEGDPWRTLGVSSDASREERREHMRWLMKWLHPDRNRHEWESVFAARVTAAWAAIERGEARIGEETAPATAPTEIGAPPLRLRWVAERAALARPSAPQLVMFVLVWVIVLALVLVPDFRDFWSPFGAAATGGPRGMAEP